MRFYFAENSAGKLTEAVQNSVSCISLARLKVRAAKEEMNVKLQQNDCDVRL